MPPRRCDPPQGVWVARGQRVAPALLAGSPAIDAGNSAGIPTDQRGQPRAVVVAAIRNGGDGSDIGALELATLPPPSLSIELTSTNTVVIAWPSPSTGFGLQESPDLNPADWVAVPPTNSDNGIIKSIVVPAGPESRFYRLVR